MGTYKRTDSSSSFTVCTHLQSALKTTILASGLTQKVSEHPSRYPLVTMVEIPPWSFGSLTPPGAPISPSSPHFPDFPSSPSSFDSSYRFAIDKDAVKYLIDGYMNGQFIDHLVQDLEDQGYEVSYKEVVYHFLVHRLIPSADRVLDQDKKRLFDLGIQQVTEELNENPGKIFYHESLAMDLEQDPTRDQAFKDFVANSGIRIVEFELEAVANPWKPFNRDAAILFVEEFRDQVSTAMILDTLYVRNYAYPSPGEIDRLLEANGLTDDEYMPEIERYLLYKDRVWPEIQVPDSVFDAHQD